MSKWYVLFFTLINLNFSIAANLNATGESYNHCLNQSNKLQNPYERDTKKVLCFQKHRHILNINSCTSLSTRLEYTYIADELLGSCIDYFGNTADRCTQIAKNMHYGENRDQGLWTCIQLKSIKNVRTACLTIAKNMTLPHNKKRAYDFCLYENEK